MDLFLDLFLFLFPIYFIFLKTRKISIKYILYDFGIKSISIKQLIIKTLILLSMLFVISLSLSFTFSVLGISDLDLVSKQIFKLTPLYIVYLFIVRVSLEEWFFRGFLVKRIGPILSSLLFALGHIFYGSAIEVIGAFILGFLLAKYYQRSNNLLPNIFAHILYNSIMYLFMFLTV